MRKPPERHGIWQQAPASVKQAVGLLNLQAAIWALLAVGMACGDADVAVTHPSKVTTTAFIVTVVLAVAAGAFGAGKFWLAHRLPRGTHKTREAVITVEGLMGCFAGLILLALMLSVTGLILSPPIVIGGIMSARVANGLTKPPARKHFDANEAARSQAPGLTPRTSGGLAQYRSQLAAA